MIRSGTVAATKYVDVHEIEKLEELGVTCFGENRVQAFLEKYEKYHAVSKALDTVWGQFEV